MYFNEGNILLKVNAITITNGYFEDFKRGEVPEKNFFDGANIQVKK